MDPASKKDARDDAAFSQRFLKVGGYYRHLFCYERGNPIEFPKLKTFSGARDCLARSFAG